MSSAPFHRDPVLRRHSAASVAKRAWNESRNLERMSITNSASAF